jgi:SHS2 domain-containing protein
VRAVDHTADVGLELDAPDLPELLRLGARGLTWLLYDQELSGPTRERKVQARGADPAALLRELLRELLWWHETEGVGVLDLADVEVQGSEGVFQLSGTALLAHPHAPPVREIKGVTLHGLVAEARAGGWFGHVIFDV